MPEINISQLADFIKKNFTIDVEVRKNIFSNVKKIIATQLASCRIFNTKKPFEFHSPNAEEIEFEKNSLQNSSKIKNIIMYDGFEFQKILSEFSASEIKSERIF